MKKLIKIAILFFCVLTVIMSSCSKKCGCDAELKMDVINQDGFLFKSVSQVEINLSDGSITTLCNPEIIRAETLNKLESNPNGIQIQLNGKKSSICTTKFGRQDVKPGGLRVTDYIEK